ncbi:MAG: response regulator transcription factor [Candidatus Velthaea sp.]
MKRTTRILLADDHPLFREALRHVIGASFSPTEIVEAHSFAETVRAAVSDGAFDLAFVDLIMPGSSDPLDELSKLRAVIPETPILVVSSRDDRETVEQVLALGAAAFISKSATKLEMERAIRSVLAGDVYGPMEFHQPAAARSEILSPRQRAVLELLARGRSNRQIASDLNVEEFTVKAHISAILRKLNVKSRLEAVVVSKSILDGR